MLIAVFEDGRDVVVTRRHVTGLVICAIAEVRPVCSNDNVNPLSSIQYFGDIQENDVPQPV